MKVMVKLYIAQFSLLTDSMGGLGVGDMRDDSAEIPFQSFKRETIVSSSGMGRDVHSLTFCPPAFLCRPRCRPPLPPPPRGALKDGFREAVVPH